MVFLPIASRTVFTVGATLIDQYDTDDLYDPDPNPQRQRHWQHYYDDRLLGSASYAYGIEPCCSTILLSIRATAARADRLSLGVPANYVLLNRRFENVGEFGYAYNPASTCPAGPWISHLRPVMTERCSISLLITRQADAGIVNLNTRNGPVLASIIRGAWYMIPAPKHRHQPRPI